MTVDEDLFHQKIKPMLAKRAKPFDSEKHIFEIKFDGTRCIAYVDVENQKVKLLNRRMLWFQHRYPEIVRDLLTCVKCNRAILDGEIVVFEKGMPNFYKLAEREHCDDETRIEILASIMPATFIVFDVIYVDGANITSFPLMERKEKLKEVLTEGKHVTICDFIEREGKAFFEACAKKGLEGVMAKEKQSPYLIGKRSDYWLKLKATKTIDCVICGYTKGEGKRAPYFGALLLGVYENEKLRYVGRVGTGFDEALLKTLTEQLKRIEIENNPFHCFEERPEIIEKCKFVKPILVCEVEYLELTKDKKLRAPSFKRLRFDKPASECKLEEK